MKLTFSPILAAILSLLASAFVSPTQAGAQSNPRGFRPLAAQAVRIEVASAVAPDAAVGVARTREAWAAFDEGRWEEAMDGFLAALEADKSNVSAAEGLTMTVYRSGDRVSAAELGEEFASVMPWIRNIVAETLLGDVRDNLERGQLSAMQQLMASLPHGGGAYDAVRELVAGAAAEATEIASR